MSSMENPQDEALARRLSGLRSMPVELARLDAAIRREIPRAAEQDRRGRLRLGGFFVPLRAVAAVVVVAGVLAVLLSSLTGPAVASTEHMVRMHDDLVSG